MSQRAVFDVEQIRQDFPILHQEVNGYPLVYLDNAATTQKPKMVIDAVSRYYELENANVHRGTHHLSAEATRLFEEARQKVSLFMNSPSSDQVIWTKGTTESINLVAATWGRSNIQAGDRIMVSELEHHANIVPWQLLAQEKGAEIVVLPINDRYELDMDKFDSLLDERVKLVAVGHASNVIGSVNPIKTVIDKAHKIGAKVLIDGAQAVSHIEVDVQALDCDFYAFSGHKLYAPTGIGVLWGKRELLEVMPPYQAGGEMISQVSFSGTTFNVIPYKFEAGTPHISGAIGLGAAIDYLLQFSFADIAQHEQKLLDHTVSRIHEIAGLSRIGNPQHSTSTFSFALLGAHPSDIGTLLNQQGIAIRDGHHCAQPLMERLSLPGTARASFAMYNTIEEVDAFYTALKKVSRLLG